MYGWLTMQAGVQNRKKEDEDDYDNEDKKEDEK